MVSALLRAALLQGDRPAIVAGVGRCNWRQLQVRVASRAAALCSAGLVPGGHVATLAHNSPAYFECLLAVWWAGGVLVPLNTRLACGEIRHILQHGEVTLFVTDGSFATLGEQAAGDLPLLVRLLLDSSVDDLPMDPVATASNALAGIFYTGGTTGMPKGVELTHDNFLFAAMTMHREMALNAPAVYLHATPLFHLADFSIGLGTLLGMGGHSFIAQFSPRGFYERLREDGVTHLNLVPTMLAMVLDAPERDDALLARIRCIGYGAAPISETLLRRLIKAFPKARIQQFYGMTECCGASVTLQPQWHVLEGPFAGRLGAAGQVITGMEVRIADTQLNEIPHGEPGEILMRGPAVMRGYWRDAERTRETLSGGWLRSGDVGRMDENGFITVVDRLKDMIISGGENIYCAEVENALATHPGVAACAVLGIPDEHWGEMVHAVVVARDGVGLTVDLLDTHCRALIAAYKVPRSYALRTEALPLSAVGKVQKNRLREQWLASQKDPS